MRPSRQIIHVDMDAFYASVEQLDFPEYRGRPVIVGADPRGGKGRGVVSAASYEARKYGVHSAQPISRAYRCCPQGIFVRARMDRYMEISARIMRIFEVFSPRVEPISLDEAFLDVTGTGRLWNDAEEPGREIKQRIRMEESLTASVGIGPNKLVAKIASDHGKPDGLIQVLPEKVYAFLGPMPVGRLWGVGKWTQQVLAEMGVVTVADLRMLSEEILRKKFGRMGEVLFRHARGLDETPVFAERQVKSVSNEHTFERDTNDIQMLRHTLKALSERVGYRLRKENFSGRTVMLKIRFEPFQTCIRHMTSAASIRGGNALYECALSMLDEFDLTENRVRLIGVGLTQLIPHASQQGDLFEAESEKRNKMTEALDALKDRFGQDVIGNAETFGRR
ncbi:MAG TPA: DNA polymerase IV [bacterium]|nr:DNA polymerase IV [bacterium]